VRQPTARLAFALLNRLVERGPRRRRLKLLP